MQRFSLHYYDKVILGHFNFIMDIPGLDRDQSSEVIFTEDYIATTSNDFVNDDGIDFPVQIAAIPRSTGLFAGHLTSHYTANAKICTNDLKDGGRAYIVGCEMPRSIVNNGNTIFKDKSLSEKVEKTLSQVIAVRRVLSGRNPTYLFGFASKDISIFEGFVIILAQQQ